MSITRIESGKRMSQAVVHGNLVFLAGQVATDPGADVAGQTRQILGEIDRLLAADGILVLGAAEPPILKGSWRPVAGTALTRSPTRRCPNETPSTLPISRTPSSSRTSATL